MTIGELSRASGLPASTLRYYEKKGIIRVARDQNRRRVYQESDVAWIQFVQRLKETGMLLSDIQTYSQLRHLGAETMPQRLALLLAHRSYVLEQQRKWAEYLRNLDDKIGFYQRSIQDSGL